MFDLIVCVDLKKINCCIFDVLIMLGSLDKFGLYCVVLMKNLEDVFKVLD